MLMPESVTINHQFDVSRFDNVGKTTKTDF